jgi:hypothetical protein
LKPSTVAARMFDRGAFPNVDIRSVSRVDRAH